MPNRLISETSLYLRQHGGNPVDWYPFGEEALERARAENMPLLVSVGYSSCHWCHVMERESFEDEEVAGIMNARFICIKVDREERPDLDHLYMDAVHALNGQGGWPLNCFALPDGRPFWGGTYFRKEDWKQVLLNISELYHTRLGDLEEQAQAIEKHTAGVSLFPAGMQPQPDAGSADFRAMREEFAVRFDARDGGFRGAPKFPMPVIWQFLLEYAHVHNDGEVMQQVLLTLEKIAKGGIFDHAGGGFARYSTDTRWKVPHFEKMLYDNAQLVSLYANAFKATKEWQFRSVIELTLEWMEREMTSAEGLFYSALDADSEGEEGRFYTWTEEEWNEALSHYAPLAGSYFGIGEQGEWENGRNILLCPHQDDLFAQEHFLSEKELHALIGHCRRLLLEARSGRVRPVTDTKVIASWNGLMIRAYADAAAALGEGKYLESALRAAQSLAARLLTPDGKLYRIWDGKEDRIEGFLEDYACVAEAFFTLYSCTADEHWLNRAFLLVEQALAGFYDAASGMFFFSGTPHAKQSSKIETYDGVIPSSNTLMARLLYNMGIFLDRGDWKEKAVKMIHAVAGQARQYPMSFAGWLSLLDLQQRGLKVAVVVGDNEAEIRSGLMKNYLPGILIAGTRSASGLPYFRERYRPGETLIYLCTENTCLRPVSTVEEALLLIQEK